MRASAFELRCAVPQYFEHWPPAAALVGGVVLAAAILVVNVVANLLSPMNDLLNVACSEWALSLHHKDHVLPCTAPHALEIMFDEQRAAFN